jgi:micrococcal nuclease
MPAAAAHAERRQVRPMPWVIGAATVGILVLALVGPRFAGSTAVPAAAVSQASSTSCDPAYPSLCIDVGIGDLDCRDIGARRFPVRPPDRHRFDMDGDGVGCE